MDEAQEENAELRAIKDSERTDRLETPDAVIREQAESLVRRVESDWLEKLAEVNAGVTARGKQLGELERTVRNVREQALAKLKQEVHTVSQEKGVAEERALTAEAKMKGLEGVVALLREQVSMTEAKAGEVEHHIAEKEQRERKERAGLERKVE